ncbi:MAG: TlpA family protein disulfide reductase [Salinivirgaceae bacterium]
MAKLRHWFILFAFLITSQLTKSNTTGCSIFGNNISYSGFVVQVFATPDLISGEKVLIASDTVDAVGNFKLTFPLQQTQLLTLPLGIYECIVYAEPGKSYQVVLPPWQPKTKADLLNPFFTPVQIYLGIRNPAPDDLNLQIAEFNERYHNYIDQEYYYIFKFPRKANIDSVINTIESQFDTIANPYFNNYRKYKYAWLKYTTVMRDNRYVIREYFNNQPVLYHNVAYMDLFNQLFANYLSMYMKTSEGERIFSDVALAKSPVLVKETFSNNMVLLNDTLQEIVLLKGLHDAFYSNDFPLQSMLITLDSLAYNSNVPEHKIMAKNIRKKVLHLRNGFDAPGFELCDAHGTKHSLNDFSSNYVYLNFISVESFACQQELELLKKLHEKFSNDLIIVSITIDKDLEKAQSYFDKNGYSWKLLGDSPDRKIADLYKVKAYPTFYLIQSDGKLKMSPALSPGENFEWSFFNLLQSAKRRQNR